jgi:ribosomal protein L11 methylase PrmA
MHLELSFDLGSLAAQAAEEAAFGCGACAVTFVDAHDDPVLEPAPGEFRLWPTTRVKCLFTHPEEPRRLAGALAAALGLDPALLEARPVADRIWEREWLKDFHALRFGKRLWVCPHHERVEQPDAVVVALDPGLAFGTGTHASTALCLEWLDAHFPEAPPSAEHSEASPSHGLDAHFPEAPPSAEHSEASPSHGLDAHFPEAPPSAEHFAAGQAPGLDAHLAPGARVIDYGCGSGVLALAAARLGAAEVHAFDIDPQALIATRDNARANGVESVLRVHQSATTLPGGVDLLLANILAEPLRQLAPRFAALLRPGGQLVLAGLMEQEVADVTAAYAACFDVGRNANRDGWVCLAGRRR